MGYDSPVTAHACYELALGYKQLPQNRVVYVQPAAWLVPPRLHRHPLPARVQRGLEVAIRVERHHTRQLARHARQLGRRARVLPRPRHVTAQAVQPVEERPARQLHGRRRGALHVRQHALHERQQHVVAHKQALARLRRPLDPAVHGLQQRLDPPIGVERHDGRRQPPVVRRARRDDRRTAGGGGCCIACCTAGSCYTARGRRYDARQARSQL
mmetsp:Transcript_23263/g.59426  ORF Transcript_23263/g.59426 Transcript_23263/m.59426 type:complete len:213 (-) Transcript_23263:150-788(-)